MLRQVLRIVDGADTGPEPAPVPEPEPGPEQEPEKGGLA